MFIFYRVSIIRSLLLGRTISKEDFIRITLSGKHKLWYKVSKALYLYFTIKKFSILYTIFVQVYHLVTFFQ